MVRRKLAELLGSKVCDQQDKVLLMDNYLPVRFLALIWKPIWLYVFINYPRCRIKFTHGKSAGDADLGDVVDISIGSGTLKNWRN